MSVITNKANIIASKLAAKEGDDKIQISVLTILGILVGILQMLLNWNWTADDIKKEKLGFFRKWQLRRFIASKTKENPAAILGETINVINDSKQDEIDQMVYEAKHEL